ncbi:hypothetical protein F5Y17DRAFT_45511 [Xylariaceae sp. FL0594]|nr:hypothetical protein F5Y17DRAFT_45511 [Xylariaceae sp. FL0594]
MDDPWEWDVERVVRELCTTNQTWCSSPATLRLPPLDKLEAALREHEVDGEVLLTYDQTELCSELGIKILKHKSTFKKAIREIQLKSGRYRLYRKRQASEFEEDEALPDKLEHTRVAPEAPTDEPVPQALTPDLLMRDASPPLIDQANENQPIKKRRLAPVLVNPELDPNRYRNIPTEADVIQQALTPSARPETQSANEVFENVLSESYLGGKSTSRFDILDFDRLGQSAGLSEDVGEINHVSTSRLIPGRMIQTHRLMKRHLLRRAPREHVPITKADVVRGANDPAHSEALPVYGESDEEYDSDTWREMEAELIEEANRKHIPSELTVEEKDANFERIIAHIAEEWVANKMPKYANKANKLWREARRTGLKRAIDRAQRAVRNLTARIQECKKAVCTNDYQNVAELESTRASFEPSVHDREYNSWLIRVLSSPSAPPKASHPRAPQRKPSKPRLPAQDDEETLSSDSDDELGDFVVDDEDSGFPEVALADDSRSQENMDLDHSADDRPAEPDEFNVPTPTPDEDPVVDSEPKKTPTRIRFTSSHQDVPTSSKQVIDLTSPDDHTRRIINLKDGKLSSRASPSRSSRGIVNSPLIMDLTDLDPADQKVGYELEKVDRRIIDIIFSLAVSRTPAKVFRKLVLPTLDGEWSESESSCFTSVKRNALAAWYFLRFFKMYQDDKIYTLKSIKILDGTRKQELRDIYKQKTEEWTRFMDFLKRLSDRFEWTKRVISLEKQVTAPAPTPSSKLEKAAESTASDPSDLSVAFSDSNNGSGDGGDGAEASLGGESESESEGDAQPEPASQKIKKKKKKKKRKKVVRDAKAAKARQMDHQGAAEREARRLKLREKLETEGSDALGSQHGSIIVNESKESDQGFVYIHPEIASRIKEHQVAGVRFMWDQLLVAKNRQGCLLAHTMGLGKTMQVITLLLTIRQAATSADPTVSSQVPEEMRESRTLILCPASLVSNWDDEMTNWLPAGHNLGEIYRVDSMSSADQRKGLVCAWRETGGIMIIGYSLFRSCFADEQMREIFTEWPSIVVADEAHLMKNPDTGIHMATSKFRTVSRLALTGSPLANNVEEYYFMINWVAPNYLGDIVEFRARYANPIKEGLDADSTDGQRRHALRMLRVLKTEVAPKVSRITIAVLKHDIPTKKEFVIVVPLTEVQRQSYEKFIAYHTAESNNPPGSAFSHHPLGLICASPSVFLDRLKNFKEGKDKATDREDKSGEKLLPQQLVSDQLTLLGRAVRDPAVDEFWLSWKMPILFRILAECKKMGDCVLLFTHSKWVLNYLEHVLRTRKVSFVRLDGETRMGDRHGMVKDFNDGKIEVFLISTKAGGLGLNITGANRVIVFDSQFNPQDEQQAVGRAYRIGQQKPVFVYRLVAGGTIEERFLNQAIWKMQLASRVVDKKHPVKRAQRSKGEWQMPTDPPQDDLTKYAGEDTVMDTILADDRYKGGIRAIQMMNVFEEEHVEEAELSAEDRRLADQMVKENELRRAGLPVPPPTAAAGFGLDGQGFQTPSVPAFTGAQAQPFPLSIPTTWMPTMYPSRGPSIPQTPPVENQTAAGNSHQPSTPELPSHSPQLLHIPPVQLPGAEVHIRPPVQPSSTTPGLNIAWDSLEDVKSDLTRAFSVNTGFPEQRLRHQAAETLASVLWARRRALAPEQWRDLAYAFMQASSNKRFIEVVATQPPLAARIAQMSAAEVVQQSRSLQQMSEPKLQRQIDDPEHLQTALQRLATVSNSNANASSNGNDEHADLSKSYRVDDQKAIQAVFERRRLKTQHKDDQDALKAVHERREARRSSSQSSENNAASKDPRLPSWARDLVRQSRIPPPSSTGPPSSGPASSVPAPPPPSSSHRPQPRTPFK